MYNLNTNEKKNNPIVVTAVTTKATNGGRGRVGGSRKK
jgi:hypothetical protein